ncbi:hypothetical protein BN973_05219 [Mycobacterium triplex]|uniref:Uncharacterized protein n=1 Tax=Mycobacterium triplex TaxID=47839 RepID=A0A024K4S9_9MYCO|nr:hypothetical protein BN973_05219 [Mycobacterium triplex]
MSIRFPHGVIPVNDGGRCGLGDDLPTSRRSVAGFQLAGTRSAATDGHASSPLRKFSM